MTNPGTTSNASRSGSMRATLAARAVPVEALGEVARFDNGPSKGNHEGIDNVNSMVYKYLYIYIYLKINIIYISIYRCKP